MKCSENIYLYFCQDNFTLPKTLLKAEDSLYIFPFTKFSKTMIHILDTSVGISFPNPEGIRKSQSELKKGIFSYLTPAFKSSKVI